jgi:hypothetical protein
VKGALRDWAQGAGELGSSPEPAGDPPPGVDQVELRIKARAQTYTFTAFGGGSAALARAPRRLGQRLERLLDREWTYEEKLVTGVVREGRVVCEGGEVSVRGPLALLVAGLEGQRVVVLALVDTGGRWATALELRARHPRGDVVPVIGPGSEAGTVRPAWTYNWTPPGSGSDAFEVEIPGRFVTIPSDELAFDWEEEQANTLTVPLRSQEPGSPGFDEPRGAGGVVNRLPR